VVIFLRQFRYAVVLVPLMLFTMYIMFLHPKKKHYIKVNRNINRSRMLADEELKVTISLENLSNEPVDLLEVQDNIPKACRVSNGTNYWVLGLKPLEKVELSYYLTCSERGLFEIGPINLRSQNYFGTYLYEEEIPEEASFSVLPKLERLQKSYFSPRKLKMLSGSVKSRDLGHETDFYGIREYHSDDIRRINWKKSARYSDLLVNEYYMERAVDLEIMLDATHVSTAILDDSISALMTLTDHFTLLRTKLGFWKLGSPVTRIPPAHGKKQLLKITDQIINLHPEDVKNDEVFFRRCKYILRSVPKTTIFFIISSLKYNPVVEFIKFMSEGNYEVYAIIPVSKKKEIEIASKKAHIMDAQIIDLLTKQLMDFDEINTKKNIPSKVKPLFWDTRTPLRELVFPR